MKTYLLILVASLAIATSGCKSTYYSAWEKLGKSKRHLLQGKVKDVRDEQKEATEQLKDALTRLQELYGSTGSNLETFYRRLQKDYDSSVAEANDVKSRIKQMDGIANDLFREWEKEAATITSPSLRTTSLSQLRDTRRRYDDLYAASKRAEESMDPVLNKFRDYVLALKHNLNAQAIGALQNEASRIQVDISKLIEEMNKSIREADDFLKNMPTT